ncbi:DUF3703 domain-containing protein [Ottowia thiooxydans]|uniref:DUF3703 domain-containing protein n=1 Tax=Ottowia thiooxydans TaxID=219182 RepID=UPI0012EB453B|nr:DUF3703 domain-containing protein [Ottowia thiooxydans]
MNTFGKRIRPVVDTEIHEAFELEAKGLPDLGFRHLERAHVLGQASTVQHVRVHMQMLFWAWRHGRFKEAFGQVIRVVGAATKTAIGLVPTGNTGGADVSPFRRMPVSGDLQQKIDAASKA